MDNSKEFDEIFQNHHLDIAEDGFDDPYVIFYGIEDCQSDFAYEDFERTTGKSYQDYLRFHDDMT